MISALNEQVQQQLEYTLLRPDCHSWWISKMQSDTLEERYAIKFYFKLGKKATETYGMLQTAFRPSCMNRASALEWHKRFKEGRESVKDDERCRRSKEVNTPELTAQYTRVDSTRIIHQSTTPSLSQTIWLRLASRQFVSLPSSWKRLWRKSLTRSHKRTSMGPSRNCWNDTTSALQPEEINSKGTRVSCVYYQ